MLSNSQNKDGGSNTTNSIITNEFLLVQESPRSFYGALYSNEEPPQYPFPTKSAEKTHNLWSSRPIFPQKTLTFTQEQKSQLPQQQEQEQQRKKRKRKDLPDLFESTPQSSIPPHCINDRQYTWDGRKGRWIPIILTYNFPTNAFLKGNTSTNCLPFSFQTPPTPEACSPDQTLSLHSKDKDSFIVRSPNMKFLGYSRKRGSKVSMSPCLGGSVRSNNTSPPPAPAPAAAAAPASQPEAAQNPFLTDTLTSGSAWIDEEIDCMNDFLFSSSMLDHQAADQLLNFPPPPRAAAAQQFTTSSSSCPCSAPPTPKKKMSNSSPPIPSSPLPPLFLYDNKPIM